MKKYFVVVIFIILSVNLFSIGRKNTKEITGLIRIVGSKPFPSVVIRSDDDKIEYIFDKKFFNEYKVYENKVITIKARVEKNNITLADGSKSFVIYTITDSSIINK